VRVVVGGRRRHGHADKYYESDFLYLYRFFIKPKTLLKEFIELYRKKDTLPSNASAERIAESENERYRTKKRYISPMGRATLACLARADAVVRACVRACKESSSSFRTGPRWALTT
jgi:hypothetical protein